MMQSRAAFEEVFGKPAYVLSGVGVAILSAVVLGFSGQVVSVFPGGVFVDAGVLTLVALGVTAVLLGITLPLHWFAWRRSYRAAAGGGVGALGAVFSLGSLSCCAPLLIPGLLSLLGFSGSSLLALNLQLHRLRLPLTLTAIAFLLLSLLIALRNVTLTCRLKPVGSRAEESGPRRPAA